LYRNGVKPGYLRWDELQHTLEKEFASELKEIGQDKPTPETVISWVRKYPDAPERLRDLRVQQTAPSNMVAVASACQPVALFPFPNSNVISQSINTVFSQMLVLAAVSAFCRFAVWVATDR